MASLIPGFEYDIFISYRQKDNKGDRWVNEFVDALKDELESTFKEEISVYFDVNPHEGLLMECLELVDKALELKPDNVACLDTKGWGLYKQGKYEEALKLLEKADSLKSRYSHTIYLHLEAAKKAVAGLK